MIIKDPIVNTECHMYKYTDFATNYRGTDLFTCYIEVKYWHSLSTFFLFYNLIIFCLSFLILIIRTRVYAVYKCLPRLPAQFVTRWPFSA